MKTKKTLGSAKGIVILNIILFLLSLEIFFLNVNKSDVITIIISMVLGFFILFVSMALFMDINHELKRRDLLYVLWGIPMVISLYLIENYYLLILNTSFTVNGAGLRVYTWNFMFVVALIEEIGKVVFVILMTIHRKSKLKENLIIIGVAFIIFENIIYMRFTPFDRLLLKFWERLYAGSVLLHLTTMLIFFLIYDIFYFRKRNLKLLAVILAPVILMVNIYIHLQFNYGTIIKAYGSTWMNYTNPIYISWIFFIIVCLLVNIMRFAFVNIQHNDEI